MPENEGDHRKLLDIWDGPLTRPAPTDAEIPNVPDDTVETVQQTEESKRRAKGSTTLGAVRGWSGGWSD